MSREDFLNQDTAAAYDAAMGEFGDTWREELVNPVLAGIGLNIVSENAQPPFTVYRSLTSRPRLTSHSLSDLRVLDLGCGQGCLGRYLGSAGAHYLGVDSSPRLVELARQRSANSSDIRCTYLTADLDAESDGAIHDAIAPTLEQFGVPHLITFVVVLDHIARPEGVLQFVERICGMSTQSPAVVCVTLDPDYLIYSAASRGSVEADGSLPVRVQIESAEREVRAWSRRPLIYERHFRNAGFHVDRCEPLYFAPENNPHNTIAAPTRNASCVPTFWAWQLSARKTRTELAPSVRERCREILGLDRELKIKAYSVQQGSRLFAENNLGGELAVVLEGSASTMGGDIEFEPGEFIGELEAAGDACHEGHFPYDVIVTADACRAAFISATETAQVLTQKSSRLATNAFHQLRRHVRETNWRIGFKSTGQKRNDLELCGRFTAKPVSIDTDGLYATLCALLWSKELEEQYRTRTEARVVLVTKQDAGRFFTGGDYSKFESSLHLLQNLGYVLSHAGRHWTDPPSTEQRQTCTEFAQTNMVDLWTRVWRAAANTCFANLGERQRETVFYNLESSVAKAGKRTEAWALKYFHDQGAKGSRKGQGRCTGDKTTLYDRILKQANVDLYGTHLEEVRSNLHRFLAFVDAFRCVWYLAIPTLIFIRDARGLRDLLSLLRSNNTDALLSMLELRAEHTCILYSEDKVHSSSWSPLARTDYLTAIGDLVESSLRHDVALLGSGSLNAFAATGRVPTTLRPTQRKPT